MEVKVDQNLVSLVKRIESVENKLQELKKKLESNTLQGKIEKYDGSYYLEISIPYKVMTEIMKEAKVLRKELERIEREFDYILDTSRGVLIIDLPLVSELEKIYRKIDEIEKRIGDVKSVVDSISVRIKSVQNMVYALEEKIQEIEEEIRRGDDSESDSDNEKRG